MEVRLGAGEKARYKRLSEYYGKIWAPVQHMWARFERQVTSTKLTVSREHSESSRWS